ncbi:MAG TPA: hypothetical protein VJH70_02060 [Candidatus Paceibacterota bacterium]
MVLVICLVLLSFALSSIFVLTHNFEYYQTGPNLVFKTILGTAIGSCVSIAFAFALGEFAVKKHWTGPEHLKLHSSIKIIGRPNPYYYWYKQVGNEYQLEKVRAENLTLIEEERKDNELRVYTRQFVNPSRRLVALSWERKRYELAIPKGSLMAHFMPD